MTTKGFVDELRSQTDIVDAVDSWTDEFIKYSNNHFGTDVPDVAMNQVS